jgi:hypothetical protein
LGGNHLMARAGKPLKRLGRVVHRRLPRFSQVLIRGAAINRRAPPRHSDDND